MDTVNTTPLKVGILIKLFSAKHYGQMLDGANRYLNNRGISTIVKPGTLSSQLELNAVKALIDENCDGLIIQSDSMDNDTLAEIVKLLPNVVFMNRYCAKLKNHCVFVDNYKAGKTAAKFLVKQGHNKIALVTGPMEQQDPRMRTNGFIEQLEQYGIDHSPRLLVESDFSENGGRLAIKALLDTQLDFTAVAFQNDEMALGGMLYCKENNISVPANLSILGFDDHDLARQMSPGLTTIRQPAVDIGTMSGMMIHEMITSGRQQKPIELKLDLIIRKTVSTLVNSKNNAECKAKLSAREVECLSWIAKGKTAFETAQIVGISESTVVSHLRKASEKLNTVNRTHAVAKAILESHLH